MPVFLQDGFSEPTRCTQGLVCVPYVVGNLKEIKSDTPNDKSCDSQYVAAGICTSVCVPQSVNIKYTCS